MPSVNLSSCPKGYYRDSIYDCRPCSVHCAQNSDWAKKNCKKACPDVFEAIYTNGTKQPVELNKGRIRLTLAVVLPVTCIILLCVMGPLFVIWRKRQQRVNGRLQGNRCSYNVETSNLQVHSISGQGDIEIPGGPEAASLDEVRSVAQQVSSEGDSGIPDGHETTPLSGLLPAPQQVSDQSASLTEDILFPESQLIQDQDSTSLPESSSNSGNNSELMVNDDYQDSVESYGDEQTITPTDLGIQFHRTSCDQE